MPRRPFAWALVFVSLALSVGSSHGAETEPPPRVGDHVRMRLLPDSSMVTGSLLAYDASALGLRLDESSVGEDGVVARKLSRESIAGLEVGVTHTHPVRGAILGTLLLPALWALAISAGHPEGEETLAYYGPVFLVLDRATNGPAGERPEDRPEEHRSVVGKRLFAFWVAGRDGQGP